MKNYKMLVQYDGTRYNGWQKQGDTDNTIQQKLENILGIMTGEPVDVHGAGRTDAGVHARGQVAQFHIETDKTPDEIRDYINEYLYRIGKDKSRHVFERKYIYEYRGTLDTAAMKVATIQLRGEHDFKSFCGNPKMRKSTVRKLYAIHIRETEDEIDLEFIGEGFLQYMVRILVGTLIEVGEGRRDPFSMSALLEAKDRPARQLRPAGSRSCRSIIISR